VSVANILKIKEVFSVLPNKKIIEIYSTSMDKLTNKTRKIQATTKGPSREQAIVPIANQHVDLNPIMNKVNILL